MFFSLGLSALSSWLDLDYASLAGVSQNCWCVLLAFCQVEQMICHYWWCLLWAGNYGSVHGPPPCKVNLFSFNEPFVRRNFETIKYYIPLQTFNLFICWISSQWVVICSSHFLFWSWSWIWPVGILSAVVSVSFGMSPSHLEHLLIFFPTPCSRLILHFPCSSPKVSHFFKVSWFLLVENAI